MLLRPGAMRCALLVFFTALLALAGRARAQAVPTASRSAAISVFGGYLGDLPDYGPYRNNGFTGGVDYTRFFKFPVEPSIELRANIADGKTVNERSYVFGVRAAWRFRQRSLRSLHPYADFLIGPGNIHYNFPYPILGDNSTVLSPGIGADYDLVHHFSVLIDYQAQHWKTGHAVTLTPSLTVIGVRYTIPFKPHIKQSEINR